jgi:hypothetical protein
MLRNKLRDSCLFEPQVKIQLKIFLLGSDLAICHFSSKIFQENDPQPALRQDGTFKSRVFKAGVIRWSPPSSQMRRVERWSLPMQCDVEPNARRPLLRITEAVPTLSSGSHKSSSPQMCQRCTIVGIVDPSRRLEGRRRRLAYSPVRDLWTSWRCRTILSLQLSNYSAVTGTITERTSRWVGFYPGSWLKRVMNSCISSTKEQYVNFVLNTFKLSKD